MVVSSTLQFDCVKVCFASYVCVSGWWLAKVLELGLGIDCRDCG